MGCTNSTVKLEENNGYKNEDKDKLSSDYYENNLLSATTIQEAPLQSDGVKNENLDNKNQCDDAESIRKSEEKTEENEGRPKWEEAEIAKVVAEKLSPAYPEWKDVNENEIKIKDVSGQGGDSTYRVSRVVDSEVIAEVAFHVVGENSKFENHPQLLHIQKTVTNVFADAGLSPRRLADDEDRLFINEWIKDAKNIHDIDGKYDNNLAKQLGKMLSKVHSIDKGWYKPYYDYWIDKYPELSNVPQGSTFWYLTGRNWPLLMEKTWKPSMDEYIKRMIDGYKIYLDCEIQPVSSAGKAVVTTHGDYHLGNIIKTGDDDFYVVDFEQTHLSLAIQDISYFFMMFSGSSDIKTFKFEFCASYLKEMGYPHEQLDAFALVLDAELCRCSVGFMSPLFETFMHQESLKEDDTAFLKRLKIWIDRIRNDKSKCEMVVERGITKYGEEHLPFVCTGNKPDRSTLITVGRPSSNTFQDKQKQRYQFLVNWDGTIRPQNVEGWKGLVLGYNDSGDIILIPHGNRSKRIQLSSDTLQMLTITGYSKPLVNSFPMLLTNCKYTGKAITRSKDKKGTFAGNEWCELEIGDAEEAIHVHFEKCGAIRLADRPEYSINYHHGINVYQYDDSGDNTFVRNEDDTLSPKNNLDVVLAIKDGSLKLESKEEVTDEQRLVFLVPEGVGYSSCTEESTSEEKNEDDLEGNDSNAVSLFLDNPVGKAIGIKPIAIDEEMKQLLEVTTSNDSLSALKICIVDTTDAAKCKIDLKNNFIKILDTNDETENGSDQNTEDVSSNMIRYGCWD